MINRSVPNVWCIVYGVWCKERANNGQAMKSVAMAGTRCVHVLAFSSALIRNYTWSSIAHDGWLPNADRWLTDRWC